MEWLVGLLAKGRARGWRLNAVEFIVLAFLVSRVVFLVDRLGREGGSVSAAVALAVCAFLLGALLRDVLRARPQKAGRR
ncbi:hypothetical protein GCM10025782_31530 [Pedococcus ginsenosidimutans]|jgi:hypothetical protein|uniref:Uncharacterized protein n=1 Tax=Pedococcus ginsenosidimutans TaxID=490570 RepID=A0ABP8YIR6_9MICO